MIDRKFHRERIKSVSNYLDRREKAFHNISPIASAVSVPHKVKSLNLFWANLKMQEIIKELESEKGRSEDLNDAIGFIRLAQDKLKDYTINLKERLDDDKETPESDE